MSVEVVVVGCGLPGRGMGWLHARQILENKIPGARLTDIVEPFFLGAGKDTPGGKEFSAWANTTGCRLHSLVSDMPRPSGPKMGIIATRAVDAPKYFREAIAEGCSHIYLEKPGAPSVKDLEEMASYAKERNIPVFMGYNKNIADYVSQARNFEMRNPGASTTFVHNNAYKVEELDECFERNAEGMLKNMAIHELCLLTTFYGATVDNIAKVEPDVEFSVCETRGKFTDFSKVGFKIITKDGKEASVRADRCGGSFSEALVTVNGKVACHLKTPDEDLEAKVKAMEAENPGWMPYFYLQFFDYITLKSRCADFILNGARTDAARPLGVASIDDAVQALKLAEYLTPILQESCGSSKGKL